MEEAVTHEGKLGPRCQAHGLAVDDDGRCVLCRRTQRDRFRLPAVTLTVLATLTIGLSIMWYVSRSPSHVGVPPRGEPTSRLVQAPRPAANERPIEQFEQRPREQPQRESQTVQLFRPGEQRQGWEELQAREREERETRERRALIDSRQRQLERDQEWRMQEPARQAKKAQDAVEAVRRRDECSLRCIQRSFSAPIAVPEGAVILRPRFGARGGGYGSPEYQQCMADNCR